MGEDEERAAAQADLAAMRAKQRQAQERAAALAEQAARLRTCATQYGQGEAALRLGASPGALPEAAIRG